jgi:hypothetical protein
MHRRKSFIVALQGACGFVEARQNLNHAHDKHNAQLPCVTKTKSY